MTHSYTQTKESFLPSSKSEMQTLTCLWLILSKCRVHTCLTASSHTLEHKSELLISSPLKMISHASHPFIHFTPEASFKHVCHLGIHRPRARKHEVRESEKNTQCQPYGVWIARLSQCWNTLLPLGAWDQKTVHNTKLWSGLTLSSFVLCLPHGSCSPTCPSFPSAKIGPTLSGSCGLFFLRRRSLCLR